MGYIYISKYINILMVITNELSYVYVCVVCVFIIILQHGTIYNINNIIKLTNILLLKAQDMYLCFETLRPGMIIFKSIDQHIRI